MKKGKQVEHDQVYLYIFIFVAVLASMLAWLSYSGSKQRIENYETDLLSDNVKKVNDLALRVETSIKKSDSADQRINDLARPLLDAQENEKHLFQNGFEMAKQIKMLQREFEVLKVQQHSLDKKILGTTKHLNVKILRESDPIPVQDEGLDEAQKGNKNPPAYLSKGKGKESLLKKSGVRQ